MSNSIVDKYKASTLALDYHASWNALMTVMGNATEPATFRSAETVVQALIFRPKLYGWLAMNATRSALLEYIAHSMTATNSIRDTMDLTKILHSKDSADELCNAVVAVRPHTAVYTGHITLIRYQSIYGAI